MKRIETHEPPFIVRAKPNQTMPEETWDDAQIKIDYLDRCSTSLKDFYFHHRTRTQIELFEHGRIPLGNRKYTHRSMTTEKQTRILGMITGLETDIRRIEAAHK